MSGQERGAELLRAVAVMDALRAPDGDAWSALQTHHSLARYLLEETHEVLEAIQARDEQADGGGSLPDELGDLLFQILFHARLGQEEDPAWDIDDVARAFVAKMERRNPHVFSADREDVLGDRADVEEIIAQWHAVKAQEKAAARAAAPDGRGTPDGERTPDGQATPDSRSAGEDPAPRTWFAGIPRELPALQSAAKVVHRSRSDGRRAELLAATQDAAQAEDAEQWGADIALSLLEVVTAAEERDIDPESALRTLLDRAGPRAAARGRGPHRG